MKATRQARREAAQLWRLCRTNGSVDAPRVRQIVDQLAASPRARAPVVLSQFVRLVRLDSAHRLARVESAAPLDPSTRDAVVQGLVHQYGAGLDVSFVVDPALIGGMRIRVGSDVYDGTVKGELEALEEAL